MQRHLALRPLSPETRRDFLGLFAPGRCGGCHCLAWHQDWSTFDAECSGNRETRLALIDRGESDGFLVYAADVCVGWIQAGRADRLSNLRRTFPGLDLTGHHAITCVNLIPAIRGGGVGSQVVVLATRLLLESGATSILAFPGEPGAFDSAHAWNGTVGMYLRAGYRQRRAGGELIMEYSASR